MDKNELILTIKNLIRKKLHVVILGSIQGD
jgi:hypothetical protein